MEVDVLRRLLVGSKDTVSGIPLWFSRWDQNGPRNARQVIQRKEAAHGASRYTCILLVSPEYSEGNSTEAAELGYNQVKIQECLATT
jgi:hypothetical protein